MQKKYLSGCQGHGLNELLNVFTYTYCFFTFFLESKAPTLANACYPTKSRFWCCKTFDVVLGVGVADICLQLAAVEESFY